ncbi:unnamed protein product [Bursaphelenchus xylophilus]|uniref:(pine wood nematode) hypothetical protein n=1 Tax=Bursaphelenchus xylophilus TaxID=6326 RepID=A0A1I7SCB3_BURXY|nr:unnamed protein product [Bursaphelenchus xylophilus]CAG9094424.1 unnamed protein product [Bursaphelenchus xylophilus]
MSLALTSDNHLLALVPPRLQHLQLSADFHLIHQSKQQLGAANVVMPVRVCVNAKLSYFDVTQISFSSLEIRRRFISWIRKKYSFARFCSYFCGAIRTDGDAAVSKTRTTTPDYPNDMPVFPNSRE